MSKRKKIYVKMGKDKSRNSVPMLPNKESLEIIDHHFIARSSLLNILGASNKNLISIFYQDAAGIVYLPLIYVDLLRKHIVLMYETSPDPIHLGYKNKGDLDFALDFVKNMYDDSKYRKIRIIKKAAFIFYNIASKHPFTDGNKRTAIITCNSFLEYNGFSIGTLPFRESYEFILNVAKGNASELECQKFLRKQ